MRDTFKKEIRCQKNRTAGYIFGLLDSRMPKPNLSNRGTTLLLLMLKRGTKTRIIALQVLIRIWAKLANERASSRSSVEDPAAPRSGSDDQASGLGRAAPGHTWPGVGVGGRRAKPQLPPGGRWPVCLESPSTPRAQKLLRAHSHWQLILKALAPSGIGWEEKLSSSLESDICMLLLEMVLKGGGASGPSGKRVEIQVFSFCLQTPRFRSWVRNLRLVIHGGPVRDLSATLLPNAGLGSGTFSLHRAGGRGVMLWGRRDGRKAFSQLFGDRPHPLASGRLSQVSVRPRTHPFKLVSLMAIELVMLHTSPPEGTAGSSEIIPLLGQDPRGLRAKQNPAPCPRDTPCEGPVCCGGREKGDLSH